MATATAADDGPMTVRVLVVDDQTPFRRAASAVCSMTAGFEVVAEAESGEEAVERAAATAPDVVLMDINLPGISGIEALALLRADPATAHIPVIALSANAMPRDIERGLEAGFFRYLTKPIKVAEFMDTLDVALKHAEQAAAQVRITP